jgi:hypothetical protein
MIGLIKALLSACLRRLAGGASHGAPVLSKRWFQVTLMAILYAPTIYFHSYHTYLFDKLPHWLFVILATAAVILAEISGHFPSFKCGTEDPEYIKEQLENGRKIKFRKITTWFGKIRGFEEFDKEWCFWNLLLNKSFFCILPALFVGYQFYFIGICVGLAYPAMYWAQLKPFKKLMVAPTNWGEFWQGYYYYLGLLC